MKQNILHEKEQECKYNYGNREHKTRFRFYLGAQGDKPIYFRQTKKQVPPGGHL